MDSRPYDTFQREVLTQLGDIKAICAGQAAHHEAITERVTKLENIQDRQWWLTVAIGPVLAIAHQVLRKVGVNV